MIIVPNQESKQWRQDNSTDIGGNIAVTKNITFDKKGYLQLSKKAVSAYDQLTGDADFNNVAAISFNDDLNGYVALTWDEPFSVNREILSTPLTQIISSTNISGDTQSDIVWFDKKMVCSRDTKVFYYDVNTDAWVETNISLSSTSQSQHPLVSFVSLSQLAVANVYEVKLYSSPLSATPVLTTTLTISQDFHITGMCYFNQNLYIATMHRYGGHAYMFVWNGQGSAAQSAYEVDSNIIFAITAHKDSIILTTGNGSLLRFNGSGFTMLDAFPVFYTDRALTDEVNIGRYKNTLKSNGDVLYILFNDGNDSNFILSQPQGIWCYDEEVGLYHKYALSNSTIIHKTFDSVDVSTASNTITISATAPITGTEVILNPVSGPLPTPIVSGKKYYVIKVDSTTIKLALTKEDAIAGTAVDITATGGNFNRLIFFPQNDFGQSYLDRTFSLCVIERPVDNTQYGTDVIWGSEMKPRINAGSAPSYFGTISDAIESRGYFITPKIQSSAVTDIFNKITLKYSPMLSELDKIIIKYRVVDDRLEEIVISDWEATWTGVNTFTTTQTRFSQAVVGDEVEFLIGAAGGLLAHITNIVVNSGTYTVTIDENFDNYTSGDKSTVVFRNWKKWKTIEYGDANALKGYISENLGKSGKFIQMKIELRGLQLRIEEFAIDNKYHLPSKQ